MCHVVHLFITCLQSFCFSLAECDIHFSPPFLPLQTVLLRLSPTHSTCPTAWCLPWHLRTPSYCTTRSRRFPLAWWPTSTITHSVTLPGKAARSCICIFEVSYLFVICGNQSRTQKPWGPSMIPGFFCMDLSVVKNIYKHFTEMKYFK